MVGDLCTVGSRPAWLALEPHPVLAFLHMPLSGAGRRTAALVCPPFGWQDDCSYRGRRRWAIELAEAGYPSAMFDLPGSGDSGGSARDPGRLEAWTGAVAGGAEWLADVTDADRIVAIGIGLGGVLACRAVSAGAAIDDLILWDVPASGRRLVRDLTAYSQMIASVVSEERRPGTDADEELECTGYLLGRETARDLAELQLPALELPDAQARRVLLLGRDGRAPDRHLRAYFEQAGASVTAEPTDDFRDLMIHPQKSRTPTHTIARTISWLSERERADPARSDRGARLTREPLERGAVDLSWGDRSVRETPIRLEGAGGEIFGVLAESTELESAPVCAVWLNGGALRHTGPNRAWVEVSRRWAARGVPTVRIDHLGVGDSDGEDEDVSTASLYRPARMDETISVLDQLSERGLGDRFVLGGLCSGAYWSLHAALADSRVAGLMLLNLSIFFWSEALADERLTARSLSALGGRGWKRLARGGVTLDDIRAVAEGLRPTRVRLAAGHPVERAQAADVELALDRLRDQDTQVLMLLSLGERLHDQMLRQGALDQPDRWPNLNVERIPSRDHMFRALWLQRHVHDALDRALERVLAAEGPLAARSNAV